jgi:hypothetical protein
MDPAAVQLAARYEQIRLAEDRLRDIGRALSHLDGHGRVRASNNTDTSTVNEEAARLREEAGGLRQVVRGLLDEIAQLARGEDPLRLRSVDS